MDTQFTQREKNLIAVLARAELSKLESERHPAEWVIVRMQELRTIINKINY